MRKILNWMGIAGFLLSFILFIVNIHIVSFILGGVSSIVIVCGIFIPPLTESERLDELEKYGMLFLTYAFIQVSFSKIVLLDYTGYTYRDGHWLTTERDPISLWFYIGAAVLAFIILISISKQQQVIQSQTSDHHFTLYQKSFKIYLILSIIVQLVHALNLLIGTFWAVWRNYMQDLVYLVSLSILLVSLIFEVISWTRLFKSLDSFTTTREQRLALELGVSSLLLGTFLSFFVIFLTVFVYLGINWPFEENFVYLNTTQNIVRVINFIGFAISGTRLMKI